MSKDDIENIIRNTPNNDKDKIYCVIDLETTNKLPETMNLINTVLLNDVNYYFATNIGNYDVSPAIGAALLVEGKGRLNV